MKNRTLAAGLAFFGFLIAAGICVSQEKPSKAADPYAFTTRTYRLPDERLEMGFVSKERGRLRAPPLPPASASSGEMEAFLKKSHEVIKDYLGQAGIILPDGSLACYDPASQTLVLRAINAVHDLVMPYAEGVMQHQPKHVAWSLEILEAPAAEVRAMVKDVTGKPHHRAAYEGLLAKSKVAVSMRGEAKSGAPANASLGGMSEDPTEYTVDGKNRLYVGNEEIPTGTQFELDPTVGPDGRTLDLNVSLTHPITPPAPRWETLATAPREIHAAEWLDRPLATIKTSFTVKAPATHLLGVWTLGGAPEPERAAAMQAAFLQAAIVSTLALDDQRAEEILKSHGEKVIPTPKAVRPVPDPTLPPGMTVRRLRVPPDFLSMGESRNAPATAADPFAGAPAGEPRFTRRVTVEEILRSAGIPFPEGASANFAIATGELIVRNTPENIALVETYVSDLLVDLTKLAVFTFHVVHGEAALIRQLQRTTLGLPDHRAAWNEVEKAIAAGKARIVRTSFVTTKSGAPFSFENIIQFARSNASEPAHGGTKTESEKKETPQAAASANATVVNSGGTPPDYFLSQERTPVGLVLEAEPTLGVDGRTVDVNIAVQYDFALPARRASSPAPAGTVPLSAPGLVFHNTHFKTSTTMLSGSTRLLSVWKPGGAPELEGDVLQAAFLRIDVVPVE